jgi:hypothetical protein
MRRIYIAGAALLLIAAIPLIAQKPSRLRPAALAGEGEFESTPGHSYLGVGVSDINSDRVQALKLKDDRGVEVIQVDQDAPAGKAGLKEHDVIIGFNGTPVESQEQFKRLIRETPPGRTVSLDIIRDGRQQTMKAQLADRKQLESSVWPGPRPFAYVTPPTPPMPAMPDFPRMWNNNETILRARSSVGVTVESLTPQLGDYFGVKNGEGLLVRSVQKGTPADAAGLRAGDVIVRVGDQKVADSSDWTDALRNNKEGKVAVVIVRDKREQTLSLSVPSHRGSSDSSGLHEDESPELADALEAAAESLEGVEPLMEEGIENGMDQAAKALACNQDKVNQALKQAMEKLHRELNENQKDMNRNVRESMKTASAELKARNAEIEKAMREAQRAMKNIRIQFGSEML